jgi:hypothetical protein
LADGYFGRGDAGGMRVRDGLWLSQRQTSLNALPPRVWWLLLPALVALFAFFVIRHCRTQCCGMPIKEPRPDRPGSF